MNQKIYWMRRLELSKIRDLYILLYKKGPLKYSEIFIEGETEGIFLKEDGTPLAKTPRYHYLNNAYKFGLQPTVASCGPNKSGKKAIIYYATGQILG